MRTLMYVSEVSAEGVTLCSYANDGVFIPFTLPMDIMQQLRGRQCWVKGRWGESCEIEKWVPLPIFSEAAA